MRKPHPKSTTQSHPVNDDDPALIEIITPIKSFGNGDHIRTNPSTLKAILLDDRDLLNLVAAVIKSPIEARVEIEPTRVREYVAFKVDDRQSQILDIHTPTIEARRILCDHLAVLKNECRADAEIDQAKDEAIVHALARVKRKLKQDAIVQSGELELDIKSFTLPEVRQEVREELQLDCEISGWLESQDNKGRGNVAGKLLARIREKKVKEIYVTVPESSRVEVINFLLNRMPARIVITAIGSVSTGHSGFQLAEDGHALLSLQSQPNQIFND